MRRDGNGTRLAERLALTNCENPFIRKPGPHVYAIVFRSVALARGGQGGMVQESIKVTELKQSPPDSVAAVVRDTLFAHGYRIQDGQGRTLLDLWLRKATPGSEKPAGPKGAVQFPFLADGELVGVLQFASEGHDYRDQPIARGVYTMRYGLQPVNGDHLGVSVYRDYSLLLPASKDQTVAAPSRKQLEEHTPCRLGRAIPRSSCCSRPL